MKHKLTFKILITTTLLKTAPGLAEVDLSNGSFIVRDHQSPLMNVYNSRSVHQGLLGMGWCSPYEDSIDPINKTILKLRDCKAGRVMAFRAAAPTIRSPSSETQNYENGEQKIVETNNKFILSGEYGVRTFDKNGKLLEIKDERGKLAKLIYDKNGYLKEIISGRKDSLKLMVDPRTGRAVEVTDHQGARTRLTFLNGNLISSTSASTTKYYKYDALANLTDVVEGNKTTSVSYTIDDRVRSVKVSPDCKETYLYSRDGLTSQTEVNTNCRGINNKRLVDFFYSKDSSGELVLDKVLTKNMQLRLPANSKQGLQ